MFLILVWFSSWNYLINSNSAWKSTARKEEIRSMIRKPVNCCVECVLYFYMPQHTSLKTLYFFKTGKKKFYTGHSYLSQSHTMFIQCLHIRNVKKQAASLKHTQHISSGLYNYTVPNSTISKNKKITNNMLIRTVISIISVTG